MIREERAAYSYSISSVPNKYFVWCGRSRCKNQMELETHTTNTTDRTTDTKYYPYEAIVISISGGDIKKAFCSQTCASKWLNSKDSKR